MATKTIREFEAKHGGTRIAQLETALKATASKRKRIVLEAKSGSNTLCFGVIGDLHRGSLYEAKDELDAMYGMFNEAGIKDVLCAGDQIDGVRVYRGQEYELHAHGWAAQRDHFTKTVPRVAGITTHFITGNHDASMKTAAGVDVGGELADRRPDWHFCGEDYADIEFVTGNGRKFKIAMIHPGGGSAYSLSYRPQKIAEQIEGGSKPNLLVIGHYHKAEFMPAYRNIAVIQCGTFQRQTPFMVRGGLSAHVGGWIVRVTVHPKEAMANTINAEFTAFYRGE